MLPTVVPSVIVLLALLVGALVGLFLGSPIRVTSGNLTDLQSDLEREERA